MSIPPPNDPTEPTRPLPPAQPVPPAVPPRPVERERVVEQVVEPEFDPRYPLAALDDRVRSLRTGVLLLGLVSVAALALAFYALTQAEDSERTDRVGGGPTQEEVESLEERVDRVENREAPDTQSVERALDGKADAKDVQALEAAINDLRDQTAQAQEQPEPQADPETAQAIQDLSARLDDLERRVEEQEAQAP